jgi:hypothetical protein
VEGRFLILLFIQVQIFFGAPLIQSQALLIVLSITLVPLDIESLIQEAISFIHSTAFLAHHIQPPIHNAVNA